MLIKIYAAFLLTHLMEWTLIRTLSQRILSRFQKEKLEIKICLIYIWLKNNSKYTSKFGTCSLHFLSKTDIWSLWIKKKYIVWNKPSHGISKNWVAHYSLMKSSFDINDLLYYTLMRDGHQIARCPIWLYTM